MASYSQASAQVKERVAAIMARYHGRLIDAEVTVGVLMSHTPVKLHGYPCAATVKLTPLEQRVLGVEDAVIKIDAEVWSGLTEESRDAVIDHELYHLEPQYDRRTGDLKADDHGRPVLKLCLHDVQAGWFVAIAERHGLDSIEVQQARVIQEKYGQLLFSWAEGPPSLLDPAR